MKKLSIIILSALLLGIYGCNHGNTPTPTPMAYALSDGLDGPNFLQRCSISILKNGNFTNCQKYKENLGASFRFTVDKDQKYIYFANPEHLGILRCTITSKPVLLDCSYTGEKYIKEPIDIKLIDNSNIAYVVQFKKNANTISKCTLNNGVITGCSDTGSGFNSPILINLDKSSKYAYIGNIGNSENLFEQNSLSSCKINFTTHDLEDCQNISFDSLKIHSLTINTKNNSAFIVQSSTRDLYSCEIFFDGSIKPENCNKQDITSAGIPESSFFLNKVYINTMLNVAYVFGAPNYSYQCDLNGNGRLENCSKNLNLDGSILDLSLR